MAPAFSGYFNLRSSRILKCYLLASCLVVLFVLAQIEENIFGRLLGAILVLISGTSVYLNLAQLGAAGSVIAFRLEKEHGITLTRKDGLLLKGTLAKSSFVTSFLILLNIRTNDFGKHSLVLLPDSMDCDSYRRLCVELRLRREN